MIDRTAGNQFQSGTGPGLLHKIRNPPLAEPTVKMVYCSLFLVGNEPSNDSVSIPAFAPSGCRKDS